MRLSRTFVPALALACTLPLVAQAVHAQSGRPGGGIDPLPRAERLVQATDENGDPRVFETHIVAMEAEVDLDGDGQTESVYTYNGIVPAPEFRVRLGDTVIVHFENRLPKSSGIHWHGIEVNNASDGTPVTQLPVLTGQTYTYKFVVTRPGVFWYHPHFKPTNDEFKGMYGSFIVTDPHEFPMTRRRVLPRLRRTMTLLLGDTTICKAPGRNDLVTFPADPGLPWAGPGPFPGNDTGRSPQELCEDPMDDSGNPLGTGPLTAGSIPNVQPPSTCGQSGAVALTGIAFAPDGTLYGIDLGGTLYRVQPMTAEVEEIGNTGYGSTNGLGYDPLTARLWSGASSTRELISIDPTDASARAEWSLATFGDSNTRDLAFLPDGSLHLVGHSPGSLAGTRVYTVDRAGGAITLRTAGGQGITALSATSLLQNDSKAFPTPDPFDTLDMSVDPPTRTAIPGWPIVPVATQLARQPGTDIAYGINGCSAFCFGELMRIDLAAKTSETVGTPGTSGCQTADGQVVLTNGRVTAPRAGSPEAPGELGDGPGVIDVKSGEGVRLQIINAAVSRYFRLKMTDDDGDPITLYRVGGEGGLLDHVRVEGGVQGSLDTKYDPGEIVLGPSERADVVVVMPRGRRGDVATLWTVDYSHTRAGFANVPSVPLLHLRQLGNGPRHRRFEISEGTPLLTRPGVNSPIEDLESLPLLDHLLDPSSLPIPLQGSADEEIRLQNTDRRPSIDGVHGKFMARTDDFRLVPHLDTSRFARVGDLLELTVSNETAMHHPFHLHGFSFQPVRMEDQAGNTVRDYDFNEFEDTVDIPGRHRLVFRVRLDDRFMMDGTTPGGAEGRWLFHCHITIHAALGMISELVVLP